MNAILKFLQSLRSLYNQGAIRSIDDAYDFAKREFGEVTEFLDAQIKNVFRKAPEKKKKSEGIMDAEVVDIDSKKILDERTDDLMGKTEESEGIMDIADKMSKKADELKKMVDESKVTESSILEDALDAATGFRRAAGSKDKAKPFKTHSMEFKKENPDYRIPGGSMYAEGNLRTAIRQFLRTEAKEGRLKLSDDDMFRITEYSPMMADDPIDVFRRYYGEDALEAASDMADELRFGESFKHYEEIFRREMPELKVKTEGAGQYDQSILDAERIMKEAAEEKKNKKILEDFDPTDRDKNATGGRPGYAFGSGLKLIKLFGSAKKLQKAIKEAVDDLIPTGDPKLDADTAVDNMLETYNIDRDAVDQYDIIDAYGKAYDELKLPIVNQLKSKRKPSVDEEQYYNVRNAVFDEVDKELEKKFPGVTEQIEAVTKQSAASIKRDTIARRLGLDPFKLNEQQKMVLDKYGNKIDDDLLKNILIDDDPQRIAEVTATIDEAFIMQDKGMGPDEIVETVKNTTRTKQAMGTGPDGLSEITDLFEKIRIKNVQKQKDQEDNKQMRFRKLLASNKFPELNTFLEAELNEDDEKVELDVRTNLAVGGSPFTAEQLAQKKQQSYLDYLARQGATAAASTGAGYRGGASSVGANLFSTPAPSSGTGGTGSGAGGTSGGSGVIPGYRNYQPNTGVTGGGNTGGSGGGSGIIGKGNTGGGGTTVINKGTEETINITPPSSGGGGSSSSGGATGAEAIAAYEDYLRTSSGMGAPLSFNTFRMGTPYAGQLIFTEDDFYKLQGIKKAVAGGYRDDGTYDTSGLAGLGYDMKGYTGPDPRGTSDGYQYEEDMTPGKSSGVTDPNRTETFEEKRKREEAEAAAKKEQEEGGGADNFPEFNNYQTNQETVSDIQKSAQGLNLSNEADYDQFIRAQSNKTLGTDDKGNKITLGDVAKFVGKNVLLPYVTGGGSVAIEEIIKTAAVNKAKDYAKDKTKEFISEKMGTQEEIPETAISSSAFPMFSKGGRVNKAVGGPLDLEARRQQSYEDYLARQPGAQPQTPIAPPAQPQQPATPQPFPMTSGSATPTTSTTTAPQPQPAASQPFDMSKYQGGTFTGGIEDSRNIALGDLEELGVDVSKYRTMTAKKDPTAPTFKGYTNTELMMMSPEEFKQKLGFDPSVQGANPEFEKFIQSIGPMQIGPGGPAGVTTEFKNQDELAQILNRAIPFYMRTARDLGENYTLQEMLAMTDEELAALEDRYDKKMGYGKYRKTSPNIQTGSREKSQVQETMEQYKDIQRQGTGIGLGSQYATGGRVGFRYGGDKKRVKKYMKPNYDQPFDKISKSERSKFNKLTSTLSSYAKNLNKLKKKKATTAAQKNLLVQNEKARKNALKRLNLLKKMYSGSKRV